MRSPREVVAQLSDEAKARLGLKSWFGYGSVGGVRPDGTAFNTYGTNDGDFAARLEDEDDWLDHARAAGREVAGVAAQP